MKIGLLEDDLAVLDYMKTALTMAGYEIYSHMQSASLLQMLFTCVQTRSPLPYEMIIIDILLQGEISGIDTIAQLSHWFSPEQLPIIVVSACSQEELERAQALFPHISTLRKPFKTGMLLQLIEQIKML